MPRLKRFNIPPYEITKRTARSDGNIHPDKNTLKELIRVAKEGFGGSMPEEEIKRTILPNTELFIAYLDNVTVGLAASKHKDGEIYLAAVAVVQEEQGKGLFHIFTKLCIEQGLDKGLTNLTTRTQNPHIEKGIRNVLEDLQRDSRISGYTIRRELLTGVYGRMLTSRRPITSDDTLHEIFSRLDYRRGDAYLITFSFEFS